MRGETPGESIQLNVYDSLFIGSLRAFFTLKDRTSFRTLSLANHFEHIYVCAEQEQGEPNLQPVVNSTRSNRRDYAPASDAFG